MDEHRQSLPSGLAQLRERVLANGNDPHGPIRETLARLGDRWSPLILQVLAAGGCLRFTQVQRAVNDMAEGSLSQRILALKLRGLERDGMLVRTVIPTIPPQVEYRLSPLGADLTARLEDLLLWLEGQAQAVQAARRAYDGI